MVNWPGAEGRRAFLMNGPRASGDIEWRGRRCGDETFARAASLNQDAAGVARRSRGEYDDSQDLAPHRARRSHRGLHDDRQRSSRRGASLAHGMRGSRQHAALQPGGRGIRKQNRGSDRQGARNRRQLLLAALDRARTHAHHLERGQLRRMDGHGIGYGGRGSAVASAVPLDVRARIPQRQGYRHQESARQRAQEAACGRIPGLGDPRGAIRTRCREQYGGSLFEPQRGHRSRESALLSGAASDRRLARYRGRLGSDGRILQSRQTPAADHQAGQLDGGRDSA